MTVSLVQKTTQGGAGAGVTAIPAFTASTAGTTLVAVLASAAGGTAFTQTTGTGWAQRKVQANGTAVRVELWTYENNPGGITAAQWTSGSGRVFGEVSEWSGSGTVTLDGTAGSGTAGSGNTTLPVTNGSPNQSGDVGIAVFGDVFSASQAGSSWNTPTGWSSLATLSAASVTLAGAGYYKTGLASGTLAVTGSYSTSTGSTGWAGIVAAFKESVAALSVTTSSMAGGTVAAPYSVTLAAAGGTGPYTWAVTAGALPAGLSLAASTGAVSGVPSAAGTYVFTVRATDALGATASKALSVVVAAATGRVAQLVGFDVLRGTWATENARIGPGDTHRLFSGSTGDLPASFDADGTPSSVVIIQSYKTQDKNVASYCASVPGNRAVILIFHHEPELDYSLGSTFVAEFKSQSALIRAQGRPNIRVGMCAAGYPYRDAGTADVLAGNYLRGLGDFCDLFLKDIYQGAHGASGYAWPSQGLANYDQFQNWLALVTDPAIVGTVKPLGITEYGVGDPVGDTLRYQRIQADHDYLVSAFSGGSASPDPLQCWCYWDHDDTLPNQDMFTDTATVNLWISYETAGATPLAVTTGTLPAATASVAYSATLTATGGTTPYTWALAAGSSLPAGLSLSSGGTISGTPSVSGVFGFTVVVTDAASSTDPQDLTLNIAASATALSVATASLPGATVGAAYTTTLTAAGGTTPYTWAVTAGALPDGLTLDAPSGTISGTPATVGTSGITAQVTDALGATAAAALFLAVTGTVYTGAYGDTYGTAVPADVPTPAGSPVLPQVITEIGVTARAPVVAAGTFVLDDPVYGKLDSGNKLADSTQWADVTGYFRSGSVSRPSSRTQGPLIAYQSGVASATLDNSGGQFDPDNPASPYAGAIRAMTPLRVRAVFGSVTYAVFEGFADGWQAAGVDYDAGYAEVTVTATDGLKILAGRRVSALPSPAGDGELSGARVTRILNAAGWHTDHRRIAGGDSPMQGTTMGDAALSLLQLTADSEIGELYVDGAGFLVFRNRHAILTDARSAVPQAVFGDLPGRDAFLAGDASTFEGGTGGWVADTNCARAQTTAQAHGGSGGSLQITSTAAGNIKAASTGAPLTGGMPVLPADTLNVSAWFRAAVSARSCVAQVDWFSSAGTYISTSSGGTVTSSTTGWAQSVGASLAPPANAAYARAAAAVLSTGAGGEVHYVDDVLFGAQAELPYASVGRANDDTTLANLVQAARAAGGAEQVAANAASIRKYLFPRTYSRDDLLLMTDAEALAWAQWVMTVSLSPEDRFETLTIDPLADPGNLFPQVLGREIGDRIQIWRRPSALASPVVKDCFIRGIEHQVDAVAGTWRTVWTLQDASKYSGFLILDDPANGKLDTAKLAF